MPRGSDPPRNFDSGLWTTAGASVCASMREMANTPMTANRAQVVAKSARARRDDTRPRVQIARGALGGTGRCRSLPDVLDRERLGRGSGDGLRRLDSVRLRAAAARDGDRLPAPRRGPVLRRVRQAPPEPDRARRRGLPRAGAGALCRGGAEVLVLPA